jgi:uncharacterized membrane protein YoaK (UPF0700 family)
VDLLERLWGITLIKEFVRNMEGNKLMKRSLSLLPMKKQLYLHSLMCVVGGFFGGYALLSRSSMFASAQTLNMIEIVLNFLGRDYHEFFLRFLCFILYASAIFIGLIVTKKTPFSEQRYSILVDVVGMVVLCLIPTDTDIIVGIMPVFFMMATQWTIFHGNSKYNSSTIFSTNNLKQLTLSLGEYMIGHDLAQLDKAKFFGNSILWYHIGVAYSFFACRAYDEKASLCAFPVALVAMVITYIPVREDGAVK